MMIEKYHKLIIVVEAKSLIGLAKSLMWHAGQILSVATGQIKQTMWSAGSWGGNENSVREYYCDTKPMKSPMDETLVLRKIVGNPNKHIPQRIEIKNLPDRKG